MKKIISLLLTLTSVFLLISCKSNTDKFIPEEFDFTVRTASDKLGFESGYTYTEYDDGSILIVEASVEGNISIPSELGGKKVTAIGDGAFFGLAGLTSVIIPDTVESIGIYAFSDCTALESITIPSSVWKISPYAFENTPWVAEQTDEFVTVGDSVLIAYNGTSRTPVLPAGIRHLGGAFTGREDIFSVTLGQGVLTISDMALSFCGKLASLDLGRSLVYVGEQAFAGSDKLTSLIFPDTVRYIGTNAALNCYGIKYLYLGQSLISLGDKAFEYCQALRAVYVPKTVTELKTSHFTDCPNLALVLYGGSEAEFDAIANNDNASSFKRINKIFNYSGGTDE